MYSQARKPSEVIALQKKVIEEQEGIIAILKGALAAAGEEVPTYKPWMAGLTPQEQALLGVLYHHYPNPVGKYALLEMIPGYDHVEERQSQLVNVKVHHLRRKLGADAIECVRGLGYRLSRDQYVAMRDGDAPANTGSPLRPELELRAAA